MTSQYSDIVSSSVVAILKRDPRRVIFITEKLFGQQLSLSLRQFIWTECLLRFEKKPFDYDLVILFQGKKYIFEHFSLEFCGIANKKRICCGCDTRKK
jgi:hypothetical protein